MFIRPNRRHLCLVVLVNIVNYRCWHHHYRLLLLFFFLQFNLFLNFFDWWFELQIENIKLFLKFCLLNLFLFIFFKFCFHLFIPNFILLNLLVNLKYFLLFCVKLIIHSFFELRYIFWTSCILYLL